MVVRRLEYFAGETTTFWLRYFVHIVNKLDVIEKTIY